ncbi:MAG: C-GCAxxG-C-C family (seleno)protein [Caldimicrobium sp.]
MINLITRRNFLGGLGVLTIGALFSDLVKTGEAKIKKTEPWPYVKIDPKKAGEIAYNAWFEVFCAQATATGIMELLAEKVGEPWASFPIHALKFGMGGMLGWGLTCGSIVTGSLVMGLVLPKEVVNDMILDLVEWYAETNLPVFIPDKPKTVKDLPRTVSNSPLCHISVGKWMKTANRSFNSPERRDRCARVAASVAYRTVELLNAWKDEKYKPTHTWIAPSAVGIPAQQNCNECHGTNIPTAPKS